MAGLTLKEIKSYVGQCDPLEPLEPGDPRNLDLDKIEVNDHRARGEQWTLRLARRIERQSEGDTACVFFSGLPGSGKSTELKRLMQHLERPEGAHLFPVYVDATNVMDIFNPIHLPEVIASLVHGAEVSIQKELEQREGEDPYKESFLTRFWGFLKTTRVHFDGGKINVPGGMALNFALKEDPSFRSQVRQAVNQQIRRFMEMAREELLQQQERVIKMGYEGMVLILDSLEKAGTSHNWHEVLRSLEFLFTQNMEHLHLPVHVIYTVPPSMAFRLSQSNVHFMPMLKLRERNGDPCEAGVQAALQMIYKRIPERDMHALLGEKSEERLREMIQWSGGYPRELIRFLKDILMNVEEEEVLSDRQFQRIQTKLDEDYKMMIPTVAYPFLAKVARDNACITDNEEHSREIGALFRQSAILRYANDSDWFDLHPSVYKISGVQQAIKAHQALQDAPPQAPSSS